MRFYTNVFTRGDYVYVRGYEENSPFQEKIQYQPYLFVPKPNGAYKTINNINTEKKSFESIKDAKEFINRYSEVDNFDFYGLTNFTYTYIYDNYPLEINYDPSLISIVSIDIECKADDGFPDIKLADKEITAITIRKNGKSFVFGCGDFKADDPNIYYVKCKNEYMLLSNFLRAWEFPSVKPDIITGWNIEMFDIPYLHNRIRNIMSEADAKRLSPWGLVYEKEVEFKGKTNQTYEILGISTLDYYQLYRKFTFGNQESYKLDYIAQIELGEKKLDYSEYGSLLELYKNNFQKFIEYNIKDTVLVDRLEDKLGFIQLVLSFAYDAKVNYNDVMTTVRPWDIIIHNYLMDRKIVIPQSTDHVMDKQLAGGYVKDPKIGMSKWVVSFDATSLYPMLMQQYNISPDVFLGKSERFVSIKYIIDGNYKNETEYSITANGCMFSKEKQGFLAALMEKMYNDRDLYKKKMIEAKKEYEKTKNPELEKLISKYHNLQLAKKIQLNSAYGALGNVYFRWFNFDQAESITTSGQLTIQWVEKKLNEYFNKMLGTDNLDVVIAIDTDSVYLNMEVLVNKLDIEDEVKIVKIIDEFCEKKIQPYLNKCCEELYRTMNAFKQKMHFKRETIANKGIWKAKKMYILNAWNVEGVQYDKPKLKMQGIEAIRSSTPYACRSAIKDCLDIIMNKDEKTLKEYVKKFRQDFNKMTFDEISFPRGVNGINKYRDKQTIYKKGTPIHVKGALLFNHYIVQYGIKNIPPILDGDKIKFIYLKLPNPINDMVIATADELPKEFRIEEYIDREIQFQKSFLEPLKSITDIIGWDTEKRATLF